MAPTQKSYQRLIAKHRDSLWRILPWTGIGSLILAFCCGIAALVIGIVSNGLPLNSWTLSTGPLQPSVLLSFVATFANAFLRVAFVDGVTIQWWLQAHYGLGVEELCALYIHGYTTRGLSRMLSRFSRVTFAAFAMILLLADGPLLQRASSVQILSRQGLQNLTFVVSSSPFVLGATGYITTHDGLVPNIYTATFAQVMQQYSARDAISIPQSNYSGTVTTSLLAPGWDVQCDNGSSSYELMTMYDFEQWNNTRNPNYNGPAVTQTMFSTSIDFGATTIVGDSNTILLQSSYKSTLGGNGTLSWRNCSLHEAIIRYPIQMVNGVVTLQPMPWSENRTEYLIYHQPSTTGGFWLALSNQYVTSANITTQGMVQEVVVINENPIANQFVTAESDLMDGFDVAWSDPIDTIIAAANEISLRAAIQLTSQNTTWACATCTQPEVYSPNLTAVNRTISQQISATTVDSYNAYQTDLAWLISGCAVIVFVCIAIAPMYWGSWNLERQFSLNPLETAKAFDAPLLRDANANSSPLVWSRTMKQTRLRYGPGIDVDNASDGTTADADAGQPLKVFTTEFFEEDQNYTVPGADPNIFGRSGSLAPRFRAATSNGPKFQKID